MVVALAAAYGAWRALRSRGRWPAAVGASVVGLLATYGVTCTASRRGGRTSRSDRTLLLRPGPRPDHVLERVTLPDGTTTDLRRLLTDTETTSFLVLQTTVARGGTGVRDSRARLDETPDLSQLSPLR